MRIKSNFSYSIFIISIIISLIQYLLLGYFIKRTESDLLLISYVGLFIAFIIMMSNRLTPIIILILGVTFRLLFIFSMPELSQDYFRFLWDGNLQLMNINPYLFSPNQLITNDNLFSIADDLYFGMGQLSNLNFSNYPPLSQWTFLIATYFGNNINNSVLMLRLIVIFFEIGTFYTLYKLICLLKLPTTKIGWYFLNPLVIIELTGNLHGEGIMMFFFLLGILCLYQNKIIKSSILIALSIGTKLITLLIIPLLYKKLGVRKSVIYYSLIFIFFSLMWIPYFENDFYANYFQTINLWFNSFEFNASIYYIIRELGYYFKGYNIIGLFGKVSPIILILSILFYTFFKNNNGLKSILKNQLFLFSFYFFIATTVHPWYIISLVVFSVLTPYFYPIIWSGTIFLSYASYKLDGVYEYPLILTIEYLIVYGFIFYEISGSENKVFKAFARNSTLSK